MSTGWNIGRTRSDTEGNCPTNCRTHRLRIYPSHASTVERLALCVFPTAPGVHVAVLAARTFAMTPQAVGTAEVRPEEGALPHEILRSAIRRAETVLALVHLNHFRRYQAAYILDVHCVEDH